MLSGLFATVPLLACVTASVPATAEPPAVAALPVTALPIEEPLAPQGYLSDYYKKWANGPNPSGDPRFFPVNVWMQDPSGIENGVKLGKRYQDAGVQATLGMWEDEWWYLRKEGLYATDWKAYVDPKRVPDVLADAAHAKNYLGYLVADEPDMNKVYGDVFHPDMQPSAILKKSNEIRAQDPSRPTYLNFGVWMGTPGGEVGYGYIEKSYGEDMKTYCSAADIASADFYGWTHPDRDTKVGAYSYGAVIDTMRKWCGPDKPLYGFVETGHPHTKGETINADQMETATWNLIVHGATGIDYFAHSFLSDGTGEYASLVTRPEIRARAAQVNQKLQNLAPVLNSHSLPGVSVTSTNDIPVTLLYKMYAGARYVVSQSDGNPQHPLSGNTTATIAVPVQNGTATVVDENRTVPIADGNIVDNYGPYRLHIYRF
jgi:hypothetical protein